MTEPLCGIELEMPVADRITGESAALIPCPYTGFDNGYNLPEMAIGPVKNLTALHMQIRKKLRVLSRHLSGSGLVMINFSEHPFVAITPEFYQMMCLPRPIYRYWRDIRNWNHSSGIDAKAHMSPSLQVQPGRAVDALNVMLGFAPAFIGIYANSPFENGKPSGLMENRLTLWPRMFENSTYPSDKTNACPDTYFHSLKDYFDWMYGDNIIHALPHTRADYKAGNDVFVPLEPVSFNDFFASRGIEAQGLIRHEKRFIRPTVYHQQYFQFARFPDARIRFTLKENYDPAEFFHKLENFNEITRSVYIEMRAPGTNLPDRFLQDTTDSPVAESVIISVCALMKGLLCNLDESLSHLPADFANLRKKAVHASMADSDVRRLAAKTIEIARGGLASEETWMLAYPEHVVRTGISNGMRGLADHNSGKTLRELVLERRLRL